MLARIQAALGEKKKDQGFTLIELLVVVLIIGILAAIAIPVYLGQQATARASAVETAVTNAKTSVVAYLVEQDGVLPTQAQGTAIVDGLESNDIKLSYTPVTGTPPNFTIKGQFGADTGSCRTITATSTATGTSCSFTDD